MIIIEEVGNELSKLLNCAYSFTYQCLTLTKTRKNYIVPFNYKGYSIILIDPIDGVKNPYIQFQIRENNREVFQIK